MRAAVAKLLSLSVDAHLRRGSYEFLGTSPASEGVDYKSRVF